jgi:hypothetical protein
VTGLDRIVVGDPVTVLRELPNGLVDCAVVSPPYYRLRLKGHLASLGSTKPACRCGPVRSAVSSLTHSPAPGRPQSAEPLDRRWLGTELNRTFARLADERIPAARTENAASERQAACAGRPDERRWTP